MTFIRDSQFAAMKQARLLRPRLEQLPAWIDDSPWPLVRAVMTEHDDDALDGISSLYGRGPFVLVVDIRALPEATLDQRHLAAACRAANEERWPGHCLGTALVVNAQQRADLVAVDWLAPAQHRRRAFDDVENATAWALAQLPS